MLHDSTVDGSGIQFVPQKHGELNGSGALTSGLRGWDLVQETLSQLSQEIKDHFETSEANENRIQCTCSNLEAKIENLTQHTLDLEVGFQTLQSVVQENVQEVSRLKSKLERFENNARRNNVRILGVKEGLEGSDIKTFVLSLLKNYFLRDNWMDNMEVEIQRVHRDPFKQHPWRKNPLKILVNLLS
ncbi:hypothetical protein NDU88_006585 [Pleurodeles waltl]|uniref:Uncharacterized protein n=1 Tax=Pleurodeles waltl TaxID=8319 RepID=A0AAV7ULF2_PLEWA|nr:hypothetical protein NDU88_006585 [Pleurodeles waltl]